MGSGKALTMPSTSAGHTELFVSDLQVDSQSQLWHLTNRTTSGEQCWSIEPTSGQYQSMKYYVQVPFGQTTGYVELNYYQGDLNQKWALVVSGTLSDDAQNALSTVDTAIRDLDAHDRRLVLRQRHRPDQDPGRGLASLRGQHQRRGHQLLRKRQQAQHPADGPAHPALERHDGLCRSSRARRSHRRGHRVDLGAQPIERWVRRSGPGIDTYQIVASMGTIEANKGLHFGFRDYKKFTFAFFYNDLDSAATYADTDWHHFCGTYDQPSKKQRLYVDGQLASERTTAADFSGAGNLSIGRNLNGGDLLIGELAELRIWGTARTPEQIRATLRSRLTGNETDLLAYYPLDQVNGNGQVQNKKSGAFSGQIQNGAQLLISTALPLAKADHLVVTEYSSVEIDSNGKKHALMRRCSAYASGGDVVMLPELRVEELGLMWVGNTQIAPTLLGYIEGAPPVPSENLTLAEDYDGATSVTLSTSADTIYSWQRSETVNASIGAEIYAGVEWETPIYTGNAGVSVGAEAGSEQVNDSAITAASTLSTTDSLNLSGMVESRVSCPQLGKRWLPKNLGYAQVISGTADVFVVKLLRSGRMVSYDIRPIEGVPLDINTVTFLINPAYTLNGSLDGMVGSTPADTTRYQHVPQMRAQYGSLYPASYFRMKEAYALKDSIERQDKDRESFFYNFKASAADPQFNPSDPENALSKLLGLVGFGRARAAFADWQNRMESILIKAGKRNVVNTYVWDGDGGLRAEEQSFASTIEHSISTSTIASGSLGISAEQAAFGFKIAGSLVSTASLASAAQKTLSTSKSLALSVDLAGVERNGITDLDDHPLLPGEKVDRYRFMTFYLEGSTNHFDDFFRIVVDPNWLMSNTEEARALRQTRASRPNKCWRVLHRVTYVERPIL